MVRRIKRNKKIFLLLILLVVFGGLIFWAIELFQNSVFQRLSRKTFVFQANRSVLLVFSFQRDEGRVVFFEPKQKVLVARGFGEYELGKIYELGELEKKGKELLRETLRESFLIPVMGVFYESENLDSQDFKKGNFFPLIFRKALGRKIKTDLGLVDLLVLYFQAKKVDKNKIEVIDYSFSDTLRYQDERAEWFKDRILRQEAFSIEVLNSTDHFGLAQHLADFLTNAGGIVVRLGDYPQKLAKCQIIFSPEIEESYTVFWLRSFLGCEERKTSGSDQRAKVSVVVSEEEWEKLNEKW